MRKNNHTNPLRIRGEHFATTASEKCHFFLQALIFVLNFMHGLNCDLTQREPVGDKDGERLHDIAPAEY